VPSWLDVISKITPQPRAVVQAGWQIPPLLVTPNKLPCASLGHPQAGWRSGVIYSMLISARRRGLNPQDYIIDILARLPSIKITHLHELLPGNWKPESGSAG
jgi:hypothetical protein